MKVRPTVVAGLVAIAHLALIAWVERWAAWPTREESVARPQWIRVEPKLVAPSEPAAASAPPQLARKPDSAPKPGPTRASPSAPAAANTQVQEATVDPPPSAGSEAVVAGTEDASPQSPVLNPESGQASVESASQPEANNVAAPTLAFGVALPPPESVRLSYTIVLGAQEDAAPIARLRFLLEVDRSRYRMSTEARATGLTAWFYSGVLTQSSEGLIGSNGFVPTRFQEQRGSRGLREVEHDPESGRIKFANQQVAQSALGVQDRLSSLLQIGLLLRGVEPLQALGQTLSFPEMTPSGLGQATYRNQGIETLQLSGKSIEAIRLTRLPKTPREPQIDIWVAASMQWLPVRIRLGDVAGQSLDQRLEF